MTEQKLLFHHSKLSPSPLNKLVRGDRLDDESAEIRELADSFINVGVIQPLIIMAIPDREAEYQIVIGERRWRAACYLGDRAPQLPCIVRAPMAELEQLVLMGVENLQRKNLNPVAEAHYYQALQERGLDPGRIARRTGKRRAHILKRLQLLELAEPVLSAMEAGRIPFSVAGRLAELPAETQIEVADKVAGRKARYVKQVATLIKNRSGQIKPKKDPRDEVKTLRALATSLVAQVRLDAQLLFECAEALDIADAVLAERARDHAQIIAGSIKGAMRRDRPR